LAQAGTIPTAANIDPDFAHFRSTLAPKLVSNSIQMLKVALLANQGIAFFTPFGFLSELKAGDLLWKPFRSAGINKMKLGLLVAKNRKLSPSAQKFVEAISKQLLLTGL
jgi:DNA-binding transcriptional LysR family regulator